MPSRRDPEPALLIVVLLLLLSSVAPASSSCSSGTYAANPGEDCVPALKVCLLVPSYRAGNGKLDVSGFNRLAGALSAIDELNNHTDGVWDDILPSTTIFYEW